MWRLIDFDVLAWYLLYKLGLLYYFLLLTVPRNVGFYTPFLAQRKGSAPHTLDQLLTPNNHLLLHFLVLLNCLI